MTYRMIVQENITSALGNDGVTSPPDVSLKTTPTIMIVDDVAVNVKVVQAHLSAAGFEDFVTVTDAAQAIATMRYCRPDVLLLDIMMPGISGLDILKTIRRDEEFGLMPVLILTGSESRELRREALQLGATDFLPKPVDAEELVPRVRNALLVKGHQDELEARVRVRTAELEKVRQELIYCLARASEYRDNETGNHVVRVGCFAQIIGQELGLDSGHVEMLRQAATLHDLGKIGVPDSVLLKPGKLTPAEFELMKKHAGFGKKICQPMSHDEMGVFTSHTKVGANIMSGCTSPVLAMAATIALTHHERWDGTGYPLGLAGEDIPLDGRITAVADVFDALSSKRPYKPAFPLAKCFGILEDNRGTHFDPAVLDAFLAQGRYRVNTDYLCRRRLTIRESWRTSSKMNTAIANQRETGAPRVVVVDDDRIVLRLISTWLVESGYGVATAVDGQEALRVIERFQPSIVLTDWNMPCMSGLELCRAIRDKGPSPYVYVLVVTSREDREDVIQAIDAGADDFLVKPIKEKELLARVGQADAALKRFRQFVEIAETDPLTGAVNRRTLDEYCVRAILAASRQGTALSCVLFDLDYFKHLNDSFGHAVGDDALRQFAAALRQYAREEDCICRYGGDEFCILLPGFTQDVAREFAERVCRAFSNASPPQGDRLAKFTATAGVAEWQQDIVAPRQLIDLADEALLVAKRSGRDCVKTFSDISDTHSLDKRGDDSCRSRLSNIAAEEIMTTPVVTLSQDHPLIRAADLFLRLRVSSVPIVDESSAIVGTVSEKDVLNAISIDEDWERPIREVMDERVVSFDVTTPALAIWDFFRRVTVRRVIVVRDRTPVGVVSRGTLLRWLGNWGALLRRNERSDGIEGLRVLCEHIQKAATAIACEAERFRTDVVNNADDALPAVVTAATRLQEQAQDLLALSQLHHAFTPLPRPGTFQVAESPLAEVRRAACGEDCDEPVVA